MSHLSIKKKRKRKDKKLIGNDFKNHFFDDRFFRVSFIVIPSNEMRFLLFFGYFGNHDDHDAVAQVFQDTLVDVVQFFVSRRMRVKLPGDIHSQFLLEFSHVDNLGFLVSHPTSRLGVYFGLSQVGIHDKLADDAKIFLSVSKNPAVDDVGYFLLGFLGNLVKYFLGY